LGFSLHEIRDLLEIHELSVRTPQGPRGAASGRWRRAARIARQRLSLIDQRISLLHAMRAQLAGVLEGQGDKFVCPIRPSAISA
jgi:hypothetical protein